jgi:translation initiation factor 2B subunit (eIF-2B alpha/beta/delta family)
MAGEEERRSRMTIDTLEYVERLIAAGVERKQAEAHARAVRDTLAGQVATEVSLQAVADRLDSRISAVAADVADMKPRLRNVEIELRVLRWMIGTSIAGMWASSACCFLS